MAKGYKLSYRRTGYQPKTLQVAKAITTTKRRGKVSGKGPSLY